MAGGKKNDVAQQKPRTAPASSPSVAMEARRPPQRSRRRVSGGRRPTPRFVRVLSSLLTLMMLAVGGTAAGIYLIEAAYEAPGPLAQAKGFVVPKGASRLEIAERLERDGIITNHWVFTTGQILQSLLGLHKGGDLKAGSYEFKRQASMREVTDVLVEGKSVAAKITIPEGLTSQQIVERLKANEALTGDIAVVPPEGSLMPDTYAFTRGTPRQDIIDRMTAEQSKFVAAAWEKRATALPFADPQQALTMASIVEKETGRGDERDKVAAVFINRLRKNMRLQSDPTIIYGVAGGAGALGRPILQSDITQKTAYNTYQIDGLPPTPIANPGRAAIEATLNPAPTQDLYFVLDGPTGKSTFSSNLKDHNAAVARLRQWEVQQRLAKAQAASAPPAQAPAVATKLNGAGAAPVPATGSPTVPDPAARPAESAAASPSPPGTSTASADIPLPTRKPKR